MYKTKYVQEVEIPGRLVLFNSLTFAYYIFTDAKSMLAWSQSRFGMLDAEIVEALLRLKFIVSDPVVDRQNLDLALNVFARPKSLQPTFMLHVTNACNLACNFCYSGYEREFGHMTITPVLVDRFFDSVQLLTGRDQSVAFDLFGGEPLLRRNREIVAYIFERAKANHHRVSIVTNTVDIDFFYDIFHQFEDLITSFRVTFIGSREVHDQERMSRFGEGTYSQTMTSIRRILANFSNASVLVNILLTTANVGTVRELMVDLKQNGILDNKKAFVGFGKIQFRGVYDHGYAERVIPQRDYYPMLFRLKNDCSGLMTDDMIRGGETSILSSVYRYWLGGAPAGPRLSGCDAVTPGVYCFYPDGHIYPCVDIAGMKAFSVGTYHSGLAMNERLMQWRKQCISKNAKCLACKYVGMCNGGCMTTNISKNGDIDDTVCLDMEGSVQEFIRSLFELGVLK